MIINFRSCSLPANGGKCKYSGGLAINSNTRFCHRCTPQSKLSDSLMLPPPPRPYFEMKAHFNQLMEMQKRQVSQLETEVQASKLTYSQTLRRLEDISNQIHQVSRNTGMPGEGDESGDGVRPDMMCWLNVEAVSPHVGPNNGNISFLISFCITSGRWFRGWCVD